jgi:hypothetical protein
MIGMVLGYRFGLYRRSRTLWRPVMDVERRLAALSRSITNDSVTLRGMDQSKAVHGSEPVHKT